MLHVWFYGCEVIRYTSCSDSWIHLDPRGGGERGEGTCVCVGTARIAQRNPRHAVQGVQQGRQALLHGAQGGCQPQVLWGDIAKMAMTAGTTHWSLGEMLRVICYKHPPVPRALVKVKPARSDTGMSNSRWLFWVLQFWCPQEPVSSVPCIPPGKLLLSSCFAKSAASLSTLTGTSTFDMQGWRLPRTRQHKAVSTLGHSMHSILNGNKPFRERSWAEGLEVKS